MDARIKILLEVIAQSVTVDLRPALESTSQMLGLSEPHMRRLFKREVGVAVQRYQTIAKMRRAAELSRDLTISIKQIAFQSGYCDVSNFYRDFRKVHGQTPRQLRSQQLASNPDRSEEVG